MEKIEVLNIKGEKVEEITLNEKVFGIEPNMSAVHEAVKNHLANKRQGTQSAKTRAEVRGGGKKPFRQKGTGNARQGSRVSSIHVGGGVSFAPKPRDYSYSIPKKVKKLALLSALSSKVNEKEMIVLDELTFDKPKTKQMTEVFENIKANKKVLVVVDKKDDNVYLSGRNIPNTKITFTGAMNTYDIINHTNLVITKEAIKKIEEVYA